MWAASAYARFMNGVSPVSWASDEELAVVVRYAEETSSYGADLVRECRTEMGIRAEERRRAVA